MSVKPLPHRPSLEYYRKQARSLLNAIRTGDSASLARVRLHLPRIEPESFRLSNAQWILAREHGFGTWAQFKDRIESPERGSIESEIKETSVHDNSAVEFAPVDAPETPVAPHSPSPPKMPDLPIGDDAVKAKTGKTWAQWFALFDAAGCPTMNHKEIVAIAREHGAGPWWQQMVTVGYEQARGLRVKNQSCAGDYQVNVSKTINAPAQAVFDAWHDTERREAWLPGAQMTITKVTPPKSLRIKWHEGGSLQPMILPKGESKCSCTADHNKLSSPEDVDKYRAFWSAALERLKRYAESR